MTRYAINHIGYITDDIAATAKQFEIFGHCADEVIHDDTQRTRICFLRKEGELVIELVEPYADNKTMQRMLAKGGVTPYHICFEVDDVEKEYQYLTGNDWLALFKPVAAPAFDNRKICYFWKREIGLIELVNKK